jgi:hypothetical protein
MIEPRPQLWVGTANILGFEKWHWGEREDICARVIKDMQAQIIGFQEFGKQCVVELNNSRPELSFLLGDVMGDIHNAIAYDEDRFKLNDWQSFYLSPSREMEHAWGGGIRSFIYADLYDSVYQTDLLFVNMHLDNKSFEARKQGVLYIMGFVQNYPKRPTIIVGDANMSTILPGVPSKLVDPLPETYKLILDSGFRDCWFEGNPENAMTIPNNTFHNHRGSKYEGDKYNTFNPDEMFVSEEWTVKDCVRVTDSYGGHYPSDHYFLQSLLRL